MSEDNGEIRYYITEHVKTYYSVEPYDGGGIELETDSFEEAVKYCVNNGILEELT